jgi:hypothetical protein
MQGFRNNNQLAVGRLSFMVMPSSIVTKKKQTFEVCLKFTILRAPFVELIIPLSFVYLRFSLSSSLFHSDQSVELA